MEPQMDLLQSHALDRLMSSNCIGSFDVAGDHSLFGQVLFRGTPIPEVGKAPLGDINSAAPKPAPKPGFKTKLCRNYPNNCRFGDRCAFAHGQEDLKAQITPIKPVQSEDTLPKNTSAAQPTTQPTKPMPVTEALTIPLQLAAAGFNRTPQETVSGVPLNSEPKSPQSDTMDFDLGVLMSELLPEDYADRQTERGLA
eukprot:Sspe_Gene.56318::Locus_30991_Transcript_1_1_Confidence_1.000_Length_760::g.56318::m.56318